MHENDILGRSAVYLHQNHRRDFLGRKCLGFIKIFNLDNRVAALVNNLERPRLDILLHNGIFITPTNETPRFVNKRSLNGRGRQCKTC
jgi:hypothetical protein